MELINFCWPHRASGKGGALPCGGVDVSDYIDTDTQVFSLYIIKTMASFLLNYIKIYTFHQGYN